MFGLMQKHELLISSIIVHAARHHGDAEVVSRRENGNIVRTTYAAVEKRARQLMSLLRDLGVQFGDRVATLAMNSDRHLELYYAITGLGAVCHTINPRLSPDDIAYIADHAEDGVLFVDPVFLPLVAAVAAKIPERLHAIIVLGEEAELKSCDLPAGVTLHAYETLMADARQTPDWPTFDESTASGLCYTSGTTGRPKGVLYSHRSTVLYALAANGADVIDLKSRDRVVPAVPMFHVNAWGLPFMAPMTGAALLMPGRHLDPVSLLELLNRERATCSVGVPTVWLALLKHLKATDVRMETLKRLVIGGAAFPRASIEAFNDLGVEVKHGWGMTESSPIITISGDKPSSAALDREAALERNAKQGRVLFGADVRAVNDAGETPWDGKTPGHLEFRGHWVANNYYQAPETVVGDQGWFPTGDIGTIDADGFVQLTDRSKDLIKSGGEWISSIELENIAIGHPDVAEAAAIAMPDETWGERPLLIVVPRAGNIPAPEDIRSFFEGKVTKYAIPEKVVIADALPYGATGKVLKTELRKRYLTA